MEPNSDAPNAAAMDFSQLKQHDGLWFDDGSIVIATDVHLYRVHKGVLAKNSSVFKDMLDLSNGAAEEGENEAPTNGDNWNGIPLVRMAGDNDESIQHLLMTLYDREYYRGNEPASFPVILSLLLLSTKYDIPVIRREVVAQLESYYPSTLKGWNNRSDDDDLEDFPDDGYLQLLAAACKCDIRTLLPTLFYVCSLGSLESIFKASNYLQSDDLRRLVMGRDHLLRFSVEFGTAALFPEKKCGDRACSKSRAKLFIWWMDFEKYEHASFDVDEFKGGLPELEDHELFDKICNTCKEKSASAVRRTRRKLWNSIPEAFGLES